MKVKTMWLLTTLFAAIGTTALWLVAPKKYRFGTLSLMLWGAGTMILVDHVLGYEGGPFFEAQTDGLIANGAVLGIVMIVPLFAVWGLLVAMANRNALLVKR
jgi:hypothetical protein